MPRIAESSANEAEETSPLLQHQNQQHHQHDNPTPQSDEHHHTINNSKRSPRQQKWWSHIPFSIPLPVARLVPILGLLSVFANEAEFYFKSPAQLRAIEALACLEYYTRLDDPLARLGRNIPELMCKGAQVQERVAVLTGALFGIRMSTAVLGTFWIVSRLVGRRRPILVLHRFNLLVSNGLLLIAYYGYPTIPIWFITLTGATSLIGGISDLANSTLYAAYADVITDPTVRSNLIFITTSLQYAAQAVFTPVTGKLMNLNGKGSTPQISFFVATFLSLVSFSIYFFFFPETSPSAQTEQQQQQQQHQPTEPDQTNPGSRPEPSSPQPNSTTPSNNTNKDTESLYKTLHTELGLPQTLVLLLATFSSITATRLVDWYGLIQYPSIKFHWTVSKTTYLICMQAVLSFVVFMLLLPSLNRLAVRRFQVTPRTTSVTLVVVSATILVASSVVFGLPGTTATGFVVAAAVYTLGSGMSSALQTYVVSAASSSRSAAAALTVMSLAATAGKVAASAIWPAALALGLEHPSGKLGGLPFFVVTTLSVVVAVSIIVADRVRKPLQNENGSV